MDGGAWWATVHGVTKSRTRLSDFTFTFSLITEKPQTVSPWRRQWSWPCSKTFYRAFCLFQTCIPLHIITETWKFLSLGHFISLNLGPRLLLFFHTLCVIFPTTSQHSVPIRVLICPEILSPSSGFCPFPWFSGHSFQSVLEPEDAPMARMSKPNSVLPETAAQPLLHLLTLCQRNRAQSRTDAQSQSHTDEANQSPEEHIRDWSDFTFSMKSRCYWSFMLHLEAG